MKLKSLLILAFILCSLSNTFAQDKVMAKAFFEKARKSYAQENWEETIQHLEKTKEYLEGNTNPDIIYIEAKARYQHDININKTVELFKQFLKDADPEDSKISEVASILVEIESGGNYYENGIRKSYTFIREGVQIKQRFNKLGQLLSMQTLNSENDNFNQKVFFHKDLPCLQIDYNNDGKVIAKHQFNDNGKLLKIIGYSEPNSIESMSPAITKDTSGMEIIIKPSLPIVSDLNTLTLELFNANGELKQYLYYYKDTYFLHIVYSFLSFNSFDNDDFVGNKIDITEENSEYYVSRLTIVDYHLDINGNPHFVKSLMSKEMSTGEYKLYYYDKNGEYIGYKSFSKRGNYIKKYSSIKE